MIRFITINPKDAKDLETADVMQTAGGMTVADVTGNADNKTDSK